MSGPAQQRSWRFAGRRGDGRWPDDRQAGACRLPWPARAVRDYHTCECGRVVARGSRGWRHWYPVN